MTSKWPRPRTLALIFGGAVAVFGGARASWAPDATLVMNLSYGSSIGIGLIIAACVAWRVAGAMPWPEQPTLGSTLRFAGTHLLSFMVGASAPYSSDRLMGSFVEGFDFLQSLRPGPEFVWEVLMWGGMYGMFTGVAYAARGREEVERHRVFAAEAQANAVQSQLDALRGQLNPHFLYNALHSLAELVSADPPAAEGAIERLGDMLRYALEPEDWDVPLAEEWEFTEDYLSIERLRLEGRLTIEAEIGDDALSMHVPRFTLQPLVENAVRHGVSRMRDGGTIRIVATTEGAGSESLLLTVADDGPGAAGGGDDSARGTGLRNLQRRLEARYGGAATMTVTSRPGEGFRVDIGIPGD